MNFMKKIKFLFDMHKQGKLELTEPSEEMKTSYMNKAESNIESAKILLNSEKLEESVSMSYFGMYHSILSLFFMCGIKSENHSASIIILKEIFEEPELFNEISFAKKERIDKQYYIDFILTLKDTDEMIKKAENFSNMIKIKLRNMSNKGIEDIRKKLMEAMS